MGANNSKASGTGDSTHSTHHAHQKIKDLVDLGSVLPNGLYSTAQQDYDLRCVRNLIVARKLAPFYKGLPEAPDPVLPNSNYNKNGNNNNNNNNNSNLLIPPAPFPAASSSMTTTSTKRNIHTRPRSASSSSFSSNNNNNTQQSKPQKPQQVAPAPTERELRIERMRLREKMLYNDAIECPICFLYYPSNINYSRCCDQPLCTECFVQIKRPPESQSTPATCPFCMQENFGIIYKPPSWSESFKLKSYDPSPLSSTVTSNDIKNNTHAPQHTTSGISSYSRPRRQTISHQNPSVVLVDHVRPNWNRAPPSTTTTTTRSSRSNSSAAQLRTVPTGIYATRQGRSASSAATSEYGQFVSNMRDMDMDLEEWMVMEAIRRSLNEQQQQSSSSQQPQEPQEERRSTTHVAQAPPVTQEPIDEDDDEPLYNTARRLEQQRRVGGSDQEEEQQQDTVASSPSSSSSSSNSSSESNFPTPDIESHNLFNTTETSTATATSDEDKINHHHHPAPHHHDSNNNNSNNNNNDTAVF
ncbi:hypothetical protein BDA99DRAFT_497793 [Phascolomyces articulosus]|uniref:RING-type domain-containing protein n=1 Tax=Phascolomyces articulosus TaxID=60185 RepID=A0AAD5PIJ4_9FUNG|nr:hypothetical protein BDA99DRAFT_497793 [Phascolomyces articulosus]